MSGATVDKSAEPLKRTAKAARRLSKSAYVLERAIEELLATAQDKDMDTRERWQKGVNVVLASAELSAAMDKFKEEAASGPDE
jgi:hypothetical protein